MALPYTPALAAAEAQLLNATRLGCPLAIAIAYNVRARALNAARTQHTEAQYRLDPAASDAHAAHDAAMAADAYHYPAY